LGKVNGMAIKDNLGRNYSRADWRRLTRTSTMYKSKIVLTILRVVFLKRDQIEVGRCYSGEPWIGASDLSLGGGAILTPQRNYLVFDEVIIFQIKAIVIFAWSVLQQKVLLGFVSLRKTWSTWKQELTMMSSLTAVCCFKSSAANTRYCEFHPITHSSSSPYIQGLAW